MEDIGNEVSFKIRSAIKAKLVELAAYVDDELPDYIMVMVANKRSKQQMDSDLKLFLGPNTLNFTGWLHTVLHKLQEVTIANNLNKQSAAPPVEVAKAPVLSTKSGEDDELDDELKHSKHKSKSKKSKKKSSDSKKQDKSAKESEAKSGNMSTDGDSVNSKTKEKLVKVKLKTDAENLRSVDPSLSSAQRKMSSKQALELSLSALESEIQAKRKLIEQQGRPSDLPDVEMRAALKKPEAEMQMELRDSSPDVGIAEETLNESTTSATRPITLMQSDDEDFEDFINIKEMKEFMDTELPEDLPKVTRTTQISPTGRRKHSPITVRVSKDTDMDMDDLEEQRASLLRNLKLLEKPSTSLRPIDSKAKHSELQSSKPSTSILSRLGSKVNLEPRLKIIDPDEFNIDGPPFEAVVPKPKIIDRLGKIVAPPASEVPKKSSVTASERSAAEMKPLSSRTIPSRTDDAKKINIMDRLGKRQRSVSDDEKDDLQHSRRRSPSSERVRNAASAANDKKVSRGPEKLQRNVLDRLGKQVTRPTASGDRSSHRDRFPEESEKPGRATADERKDPVRRRNASPPEKRSSDDTFKSRFMDRLGKKETKTDRSVPVERKIADRLGRKVTTEESDSKRDGTKRPTRIISIKEALEGELKFSSNLKRKAKEEVREEEKEPRKRALLSRVVAVKREERAEEPPDASLAVASVVRVKARPKRPASQQANKNLLLKAMAEAHKSVATAPIRQEPQSQPEAPHKDGYFTRKYRQTGPEKINITVSNPLSEQPETEKEETAASLFTRKFRETAPENMDAKSKRVKMEPDISEKESPYNPLFTKKYLETHPDADAEADAKLAKQETCKAEPQNDATNTKLFTRKIRELESEKTSFTVSNPTVSDPEPRKEVKGNSLYSRKFREMHAEKMKISVANEKAIAEKKEDVESSPNSITRTFANLSKYQVATNEIADSALDVPHYASDGQVSPDVLLVSDDDVLEEIYEEDDDLVFATSYRSNDSQLGNVSPVNVDDDNADEGNVAAANSAYVPSKVYSEDDEPELQHGFDMRRLGARTGVNPQFVVTMDGLDPSMFNPRKRTLEHHTRIEERPASPLPVPEHERIKNWLISLDKLKMEKEATVSPVPVKKPRLASTVELVTKPKPPERCKYWPTCRQGDLCEYHHPTTPCTAFPICVFGDKCIYVHPNCRFANSCTRQQCPYTHTAARPMKAVLPTRSRTAHVQPVCKFHPKCSNVNCSFMHPMPCRFGRSCTNSECTFYHEELPSTEKLKWVKTKAF